jgi:hypothetical protein
LSFEAAVSPREPPTASLFLDGVFACFELEYLPNSLVPLRGRPLDPSAAFFLSPAVVTVTPLDLSEKNELSPALH